MKTFAQLKKETARISRTVWGEKELIRQLEQRLGRATALHHRERLALRIRNAKARLMQQVLLDS